MVDFRPQLPRTIAMISVLNPQLPSPCDNDFRQLPLVFAIIFNQLPSPTYDSLVTEINVPVDKKPGKWSPHRGFCYNRERDKTKCSNNRAPAGAFVVSTRKRG